MAKKRAQSPALNKKRRSFYDFCKDYPGTAYTEMRKQNTKEIYDTKGKIRLALKILGVVLIFLLAYLFTYMLLEISHQPILR